MRRFVEQAGRPVVMGRNGAVSAGHPLASMAGIRILQAGGNAVDAAVAVAAALNVVEPPMSGLGGDLFALVYDAGSRRVLAVNGTGPAPARATVARFAGGIPPRGPLSASVPGAFAGWAAMLERWGRLELGAVLRPAIELAAEGFPISHNLAGWLEEHRPVLERHDSTAAVFFPGGRQLQAGDILIQRDLAATFRNLATGGADAFYRGAVAEEIVRATQGADGILDSESLADCHAEITEPLSVDYRGYRVYEPPPNCTGHVLLQELAMLSQLDPSRLGLLSADLVHQMVEIKKLAFADRERHNGDPRMTGELPEWLLSAGYARRRLAQVDPARAARSVAAGEAADGETTYFAVADRDGNLVSMTTSINMAFGSGFIAGRTGILLNNRMTYWHLDPEHPNALAPGKRVRHTISPAMVLRDDEPVLVIGTPGSDGQVQTIFQVLVNLLDFGVNPQTAVELPRWRSFARGTESNLPHGLVDVLQVEGRMPNATIEGLQARGHRVVRMDRWGPIGSCQVIQIAQDRSAFLAAADPRADAYAISW